MKRQPKPWSWEEVAPSPRPKTVDEVRHSLAQRRRRAMGAHVEQVVEHRLRGLGLAMVERVHTGMAKIAGRYVHTRAVAGDFRAVLPPSGRSVLVEVKHRDEATLKPSALTPGQTLTLTENELAGGLSLLVWARGLEFAIVPWSCCRMYLVGDADGTREPLRWETAQAISLTSPLSTFRP